MGERGTAPRRLLGPASRQTGYVATPGICRDPARNSRGGKFEWKLRDYETAGKLRKRETIVPRPLTLREMERPRRGRSFSLELPKARPQNKWMQFLPWEVWAEVKEEASEPLRAALGCPGADDRSEQLFADYLAEFTHGRLLLRVIRLCHERLVPPGDTAAERQARMDRWLPPSWSYDDTSRTLS